MIAFSGLLLGFGSGCDDSNEPDPGEPPEPPRVVSAEVGVPSPEDDLEFAPLEDGAELRLQTFGQGGTHVLLGVRCTGFGKRAFVAIALKNLVTGAIARTAAPASPQLLLCHDELTCDLVPLLAMASGLTEPGEERDGLHVEITAIVHSPDGELEASATREAVLSTADL